MTIQTHRIAFALGLLAIFLAGATKLLTEIARVPVALELGHAAGRHAASDPLFLAGSNVRTPRLEGACAEQVADKDLSGMYLTALACRTVGRGDLAIAKLRVLTAVRFRLPLSSAMLALELHRKNAVIEAAAVWQTCPADACEELLTRSGTIETCSAAASLSNGGRRASFCMGELLRHEGNLDEAMTWFERALKAPGGDITKEAPSAVADPISSTAEILYRMGEVEFVRGRLESSWRFTIAALQHDPNHYWAPFQRARLLAREGRAREAIAELLDLIKRYPTHGAAMLNLGNLYESHGDLSAA